jgi:hypothetical protein
MAPREGAGLDATSSSRGRAAAAAIAVAGALTVAATLATPAVAAQGPGCKYSRTTVTYDVRANGSQVYSGQSNRPDFPGGQEATFAFALTFEDVKASVDHFCPGGGVEQWTVAIPGLRENGSVRPTPRADAAGADYTLSDTRVDNPPPGLEPNPTYAEPCGWQFTASTSLLESGLTTVARLKERNGNLVSGALDADAGLAAGPTADLNAYAQTIAGTHDANCPGRLFGLAFDLPETRADGIRSPDPRPLAPRAEFDADNTSNTEVLREVLKHLAKGRSAFMGAENEGITGDFGGWGSNTAGYRVRMRFNRSR